MQETEIGPRYLDYEQASQFTGLSRQTLWRAIRAREIAAFKVGRRTLIDRESLERYVTVQPWR